MKKILCILCGMFVWIGCSDEPTISYYLEIHSEVPIEKQEQLATFVKETVKNATYKLTTSDYEDVDDTIREAYKVGVQIYAIRVIGMQRVENHGFFGDCYSTWIPIDEMTDKEKELCKALQ
jgi:hypothetical protein